MDAHVAPGTRAWIDGQLRVYYDGYWIKVYEHPSDTLLVKKHLIQALTRRLFNHVEYGLNVPGTRLNEARRAYDEETRSAFKRVKGAMLAGALFNRAADILSKLVELQAVGVNIQPNNPLMRECGSHLQEALELGRLVLHRSGEEGIDELWGEPFKAFAFPVEAFYESRYVKIAQTMRDIDHMAETLTRALEPLPPFRGIEPSIRSFAAAARRKSETLRTDRDIFEVWSSFVVAGETLSAFEPRRDSRPDAAARLLVDDGMELVQRARAIVLSVTRARVPMPKTTAAFIQRCEAYREDAERVFRTRNVA
jgi:hypothetical protein